MSLLFNRMDAKRDGYDDGGDGRKESKGDEKSSSKSSQEGKVFGNYEIVKAIGKGKFAVVYRALNLTDGQTVALKRISVDTIDDKTRDKTLKEIKLVQSLDHPNIIKYMDSFISENDLVMVFEWAAAGDLKRQLRKQQERGVGFDERIIWKYFSQIADALQHMHERRVMHRDLKPANIFLTPNGTIKVGDLGLSRELSEHTVQAHSKVGTPLYMSPEVLRGDGYDFKSDVWSLGCMLYELAMLKSPFKSEGLNLYALFQKISAGDYQPLPDEYSEKLRSLTYTMISTDPKDRPEIGGVCSIAAAMKRETEDRRAAREAAREEARVASGAPPRSDSGRSQGSHERGEGEGAMGADSEFKQSSSRVHNTSPRATPGVGSAGARPDSDSDFLTMPAVGVGGGGTTMQAMSSTVGVGDDTGYSGAPDSARSGASGGSSRDGRSGGGGGGGGIKRNKGGESQENRQEKFMTASSNFGAMEMLYDKIVALVAMTSVTGSGGNDRNEGNEVLNGMYKFHFALDLSLMNIGNTKNDVGGAGQYRKMVQVAVWLSELCRPGLSTLRATADVTDNNPISVARRILREAELCGVDATTINSATPPALAKGHGEVVCSLLSGFADVALNEWHHARKPFLYHTTGGDPGDDFEKEDGDGDGDGGEIVDDEEQQSLDGVDMDRYGSGEFGTSGGVGAGCTNGQSGSHGLVWAYTDPAQWREEAERLGPQLTAAVKISSGGGIGLTWASHVDALQNLSRKVSTAFFPSADQSSHAGAGTGTGTGTSDSDIGLAVSTNISQLSKDIDESLNRLKYAENLVNSTSSIGALATDYKGLHVIQEELRARQETVTERVATRSDVLADLAGRLADTSEDIESRANGRGEGGSHIVTYKEAIRRIQTDINYMSLGIGLASSSLLAKRQESVVHRTSNRRRRREMARRAHRSNKVGGGADDVDTYGDDW